MSDQLIATVHLIKAWISGPHHDERGNVTLEHVLWAVLVIGLVAIVAAALTSFVQAQIALIH
jgi:hypothetical protein